MDLQANTNLEFHIKDNIPREIFRTYDIRGIVGEGIDSDAIYTIARALAVQALDLNQSTIIVGRDGRLSSPELIQALRQGLLDSGVNVVDIGIVPTPLLYFATKTLAYKTGIMLTASHNPANYNGLKIVMNGRTLASDDIADIYKLILERKYYNGEGVLSHYDHIIDDYIDDVRNRISIERPLKIVIDCGNGVAGLVAPTLFRDLGCEVIELYCDIDGRFPNHHPDPTIAKNLQDIIAAVKKHKADCGLAFDGDADRLGVIDNTGNIIWPDRLVMLFAEAILQEVPGGKILYDVKCSKYLPEVIRKNGGKPMIWKTGHSVLKAKMLEEHAVLAGELSGHIFFNYDWYGFDDGLFVGAKLLARLSQQSQTLAQLMKHFPDSVNTPELKVAIAEDRKDAFMQRLMQKANFADANVITIDGLRVEFPFGWGLVRCSNTTPALTVRFEADDEASLEKVKSIFRELIHDTDPSLELPF